MLQCFCKCGEGYAVGLPVICPIAQDRKCRSRLIARGERDGNVHAFAVPSETLARAMTYPRRRHRE